jgi:predicted O-methyltransferase YrrM
VKRFAKRGKKLISKTTSLTVERFRGRRDSRRLSLMGLGELKRRAIGSEAALSAPYERYTQTISTPVMALSLELAGTLDALCNMLRARCVADLGSGFSSYVFRRYAARGEATVVVSVDADSDWLTRTRDFLELEGLSAHELVGWDAFVTAQYPAFDLVLDDLGDLQRRIDTIPRVLELVRPAGFIVFDDFHKPNVRSAVLRACRAGGHEAMSLRSGTLDEFGRYACLVRRRG